MNPVFLSVQFVYWLALATWLGSLMFVAITTPIIFRTVRENDPTLPMVLSVNLEGEHSTVLAGSIVANVLQALVRIQLLCAGVLILGMIAQWWALYSTQLAPLAIRTALLVAASGLLIYDWKVVSPRIFRHRQEYIDNADNPEKADAARQLFNRYQREGITVMMLSLFAIMGLLLFSVGISTAQSIIMK